MFDESRHLMRGMQLICVIKQSMRQEYLNKKAQGSTMPNKVVDRNENWTLWNNEENQKIENIIKLPVMCFT